MLSLKTLLDARQKPVIVFLAVLTVYLPMQEVLLLYIGDDTTLSAAVVPILFCGWFLGAVWAFYTGLTIGIGFSLFKLLITDSSGFLEIAVGVTSIVMFTLIGLAIGRMEELNRLVKKELLARTLAEKALEVKTQQLSHSNQELEQFAYIASHDLQEPLRKITAFSSRLMSKYQEQLGEQGADYLQRMENAAIRMQSLIEGLLTFSRVTTKGQPFEKVDLSEICRDVLVDLETAIKEKNAEITYAGLPTIDADALQMRQLFQNIIGNALKYQKEGTVPIVNILCEVKNNQCTIVIKDNGIGFDQKYADQIFGVFQRLHAKSSIYKGSGIGLSVCRKIADRHGGAITASSEPDKGATFTICLPLHQKLLKEEAS